MYYTIESFINFCDDMQIVEEGFKDNIKKFGKAAWQGLLKAIKKLLEKIRDFRNKIRMRQNRDIKIETNWYKSFLGIEYFIEKGPTSMDPDAVDQWKKRINSMKFDAKFDYYNFSKNKKDYTTTVRYRDVSQKVEKLSKRVNTLTNKIEEGQKKREALERERANAKDEDQINLINDKIESSSKFFNMNAKELLICEYLYEIYAKLWELINSGKLEKTIQDIDYKIDD